MNFKRLLRRFIALRGRHLASHHAHSQPPPDVTSDDVERIVRREFPDEQFAPITALLNEYVHERWQRESSRVRLAVLKLAHGSVEKLRVHIEAAKSDYRDVLAAAEYPDYCKIGFRIRELPADEQRRIINRDWKQYEDWLRIMMPTSGIVYL
jgi:hypothetical protein